MIVNLDSESGAACLKKAADAGVVSIDYDRLTLGGGASYYVSFDNVEVGRLMGAGPHRLPRRPSKTKANIIYINGAPTDNNAALFKQGYEEALAAEDRLGRLHPGRRPERLLGRRPRPARPSSSSTPQNKGKIDGVVSANDTMAGGIIARMKAQGVAGKIPVTGQDAIGRGSAEHPRRQPVRTVYKNTDVEAETASSWRSR